MSLRVLLGFGKQTTLSMRVLPPKQGLIQLLGSDDFFLWEYYGEGVIGKIQAWIFRSRIKTLMVLLKQSRLKPRMVLDVGCGPMFVSYPLVSNAASEYVGVDVMPADSLKKYRDAMKNIGIETIEAVRASAELLPFQDEVFDLALSLDVFEHLIKPKDAAIEIHRVVKNNCLVGISLPLENWFQRMSRIGFTLLKIMGDPILKRAKRVPSSRTPEYHYVGDLKSYGATVDTLKKPFISLHTTYTPLGCHKSINVNAIHIFKRSNKMCVCTLAPAIMLRANSRS